jgi:hypothetical protein
MDLETRKELDRVHAKLNTILQLLKKPETATWVGPSKIARLTGWTNKQMQRAREKETIVFRRSEGGGYEYKLESLSAYFLVGQSLGNLLAEKPVLTWFFNHFTENLIRTAMYLQIIFWLSAIACVLLIGYTLQLVNLKLSSMVTFFTFLIGAVFGSVFTAAWFAKAGRWISCRLRGRKKRRITVSHNGNLINLDDYEIKISQWSFVYAPLQSESSPWWMLMASRGWIS